MGSHIVIIAGRCLFVCLWAGGGGGGLDESSTGSTAADGLMTDSSLTLVGK
jgi:hypothetical protein